MTQFSIESTVENFNKMYKPLNLKIEVTDTKDAGYHFSLFTIHDPTVLNEYSFVLDFNSHRIAFNTSPLSPEQYLVFHQFYELIDWFVFKKIIVLENNL